MKEPPWVVHLAHPQYKRLFQVFTQSSTKNNQLESTHYKTLFKVPTFVCIYVVTIKHPSSLLELHSLCLSMDSAASLRTMMSKMSLLESADSRHFSQVRQQQNRVATLQINSQLLSPHQQNAKSNPPLEA